MSDVVRGTERKSVWVPAVVKLINNQPCKSLFLFADERRCFRHQRRLPPGRWRLRLQLYSLHLRLHLRGVRLFGARPPLRIAVLAPIAAEELPLVAAGSVGVTR